MTPQRPRNNQITRYVLIVSWAQPRAAGHQFRPAEPGLGKRKSIPRLRSNRARNTAQENRAQSASWPQERAAR
eukprot:128213-Pyramimonas_sp.AAC.1